MSIRDKEELLFAEWEVAWEGFVRDGVVCEVDYLQSDPKITFIFKEVNDENGGGWDLRKFIAEEKRPQTWNNVARWVHGIRQRRSMPTWDFYAQISDEFRTSVLRSICVVNLKKSPGTHTTNHASLTAVATQDKERLKCQFSLYDADLTICGGTGDLFKRVAGHETMQWKITNRGIWWYETAPRKYVISFAHPEARVADAILLYSLVDAVNEICEE